MDGTPTALMDDRDFPSENTMIICRRRRSSSSTKRKRNCIDVNKVRLCEFTRWC
jgi:hypothetical protein